MRLINTQTLHLDEFYGTAVPPYAILSHTWTASELNLQDWLYAHGQNPPRWGWVHLEGEVDKIKAAEGYRKIRMACERALRDGFSWLWADTVCIDKTSSAELSEAINSMYDWYFLAKMCYAFLEDVPSSTPEECNREGSMFRASRWFKRGWTLQELLAPRSLQFVSSSWTPICAKAEVGAAIEQVTGIPLRLLSSPYTPQRAGARISDMMAWACRRQTSREEDVAYCLLGLFGVNIPLLYGEKRRAFRRLQLEVISQTAADWTFLDWDRPQRLTREADTGTWGLETAETLATEPGDFQYSHANYTTEILPKQRTSLRVSTLGLELRLPLMETACDFLRFAVLPLVQNSRVLWMPLWGDSKRGFRRIAFPSVTFSVARNGSTASPVDIVLPIYTERNVGDRLPSLRPALRPGRISPASILLTWPTGIAPPGIQERFPDGCDGLSALEASLPNRLDKAILRLRLDDVARTVAYGAIKFGGRYAGDSHDLFFAVEFESTVSLRPKRWMCSNLVRPWPIRSLEAQATKKVRDLAKNGLSRTEFPLQCFIGGWNVSLDCRAFDSSNKEYLQRYEPGSSQWEPVDYTSNRTYEENIIVAQFRR